MKDEDPEHGRGAWALITDRSFGPYFVAGLISQTGVWLQNIAALLIIFELTDSAFMAGLVTMLHFGMQLVLTPWTGLLADQVDRRMLMLIGQLIGGAAATVLAIAAWTEVLSSVLVVAMVGVAGIGTALAGPAIQAALPSLVGKQDLGQAMALHSVTFNLSRAIGPAVGAALYTTIGPAVTFAVNAATYVLFVVVLARLPFARIEGGTGHSVGSIWDGVRYVRENRTLAYWLVAVAIVGIAMEPVNTLGPPLARLIGGDASLVGTFVSAFGVGAVIMAFLIGWLRPRVSPERSGLIGMVGVGVGMFGFALSGSPAQAVAALVVGGAGYMLAVSDFLANVQADLPDRIRGRVLALWSMALLGCRPIAAAVHGAAGDLFSPRVSTAVTAVVAGVVAVLIWRARTRKA